jgi:hypothetical protein
MCTNIYKNITTRYNGTIGNDEVNNECDKITHLFKNLAIDTKTRIILPAGTQLCPELRYPLLKEKSKMEDIFYITLNQSIEIRLDSEIRIKINNNDFVVVDQNISWAENNTYVDTLGEFEHQGLQTITIPKNTQYCIPDPTHDLIGLSHLLQIDEKFKIRPGSTVYLLEGTEVVMLGDSKNNVHMILKNMTKCNI